MDWRKGMEVMIRPSPVRADSLDYGDDSKGGGRNKSLYIGRKGILLDDTGSWVALDVDGELVLLPKEDVVKW